jgi:hypothetical protein
MITHYNISFLNFIENLVETNDVPILTQFLICILSILIFSIEYMFNAIALIMYVSFILTIIVITCKYPILIMLILYLRLDNPPKSETIIYHDMFTKY